MRKIFVAVIIALAAYSASAQVFNAVPRAWKWIGEREAAFTYDGTFTDSSAFAVNVRTGKKRTGIKAPARYTEYPIMPEGAVNLTYSPDSTMLAFTRNNDLYVVEIESGQEMRLTFDGSEHILNGYASWVYYEEILGRSSRYKAFWWSPDSRKIGFYRFDNTDVPSFPIYSAFSRDAQASQSPKVTDLGLGGSVSDLRYPKCGQNNPEVRIGIVTIPAKPSGPVPECGTARPYTVWADFNEKDDQYFGIPFWGPDSKAFFVARMPRLQNTLDLYSVNIADGKKRHIYKESYPTWINWMNNVVFTDKGLYMARNFETGWQQIYFLSYDGKEFRRLTDGTNWAVSVLRVDEKRGEVYFTARRDATVRQAVYKVNREGVITALTDPVYNATGVTFSPDGKYFIASLSNVSTPTRIALFQTSGNYVSEGHGGNIAEANLRGPVVQRTTYGQFGLQGRVVADAAGKDYDPSAYSLGKLVHITTSDGFTLPAMVVYPKGFDQSRRYPVHVDIYGGPDTPVVRDRWITPDSNSQWWSENGIIQIWVDPRSAGHNGRLGLDMIYRQLTVYEVKDFIAWADWLRSLPYVDGDRIGVEGFSFGGTMTSMLLMQASDRFHYGIAGGGVYDWALYDSHYTERYMDTPQNNPEGYEVSKVINYVEQYPTTYGSLDKEPVMLKLTHGTGDDNVHHQNTLQLIDALHRAGKKFELMIYPDGMHGYYGYQGKHFLDANREFWRKYLL